MDNTSAKKIIVKSKVETGDQIKMDIDSTPRNQNKEEKHENVSSKTYFITGRSFTIKVT